MLLSVIVPVYNTKEYLQRCLDSILGQRMADLEVICVDDGSTDGSGETLDQYARLDPRVRVLHKANAGSVAARKRGIALARGKYAAFVDSDDWIESEMYEALCGIADRYGADMVASGYILENGTGAKFYDGFPEGLYQGREWEELWEQVFFCEKERDAGIRPSLCTKLFRTSLLGKVLAEMPNGLTKGEDRVCTVAYSLEVRSAYILKRAFYHYTFRRGSMSHCEDAYCLDRLGEVYRAFLAMYRHPNFSERLRTQCELYMFKVVMDALNSSMGFPVPDLMWVNPRWMEEFPRGSKILLYGAGRLGKAYYRHIVSDRTRRLSLSGWVDRNYRNLRDCPQEIKPPESIRAADYDYILLALADRQPAEKAKIQLAEEFGVDMEKIIWIGRKDIFWEYAEAAGLLEEG